MEPLHELLIYNTQSRQKEVFKPQSAGKVTIYVCGMTVYDYCHLGHARAYTAFDVVVRFLRYLGNQVTYVRNITDIDDKIIKRARENQPNYSQEPLAACRAVTEKFTQAFHEDMNRLDLARPDVEPRATEHLEDIFRLIQKLVDKGHAYAADGSIYFDVKSFGTYGKLSQRDPDDMETQSRLEPDPGKRHPMDFALWKKAGAEEPSWDSPFGPGRPGWHIECSAMSMHYLGNHFDIHGGGRDLVFPHHENELCQSEAATGKPFVNYWMHNGFITSGQEKMSKSLGNFKTLRDCFARYPARLLKYYLLSTHYRSPLEFDPEKIENSREGLKRIENTVTECDNWLRDQARTPLDEDIEIPTTFMAAMSDDFNTPKALGALHNACTQLNTLIQEQPPHIDIIQKNLAALRTMLGILGLTIETLHVYPVPESQWQDEDAAIYDLLDIEPRRVSLEKTRRLIQLRGFAKLNKNYDLADRIRDWLTRAGVELRDQPDLCTFRWAPAASTQLETE